MVKLAEVVPDWTLTEAGAVKAEARLFASDTFVPPPGAAFEIVTVQLVDS